MFFQDRLAGWIEELPEGYAFRYAPAYLADPDSAAISVTLPLRADAYSSASLHPFFDGLIPEGWLLELSIRNWKLNPRDRMGLLLTVCGNCVGAVSIEPETTETEGDT